MTVAACNTPPRSDADSVGLLPIPDGLVVLTFDDGNKRTAASSRPRSSSTALGASFYITEGLGFTDDPNNERYNSWEDVRRLHELGFEVGNHTGSHPDLTELSKDEIRANLEPIEQRCEQYGARSRPPWCIPPGITACL